MKICQTLKLLEKQRQIALLQRVSLIVAVSGLALFTVPALLDHLLGGALQSLLLPAIYNAIHELRRLLGILNFTLPERY
jgi:hypothetical protein